MNVFVAGEGTDELGGWGEHPSYRDRYGAGAIELLLRRIHPAIQIVGGKRWKDIRKLRVGHFKDQDAHNVRGVHQHAIEAGADVLAFVRDRDGSEDRERAIEQVIRELQELHIIGGVAVEELESWMLSLLGERGSERLTDAKNAFADRESFSSIINRAELDELPDDAHSLRLWLDRAWAALTP